MIRYRTEVDNKWVYFKNKLYNPVTLYFISGKHKYEFKKINIYGTKLPNLRFFSSRATPLVSTAVGQTKNWIKPTETFYRCILKTFRKTFEKFNNFK